MFEAGEISLGKSALGRPLEIGYATTVGDARQRLAALGATPSLAETCAEIMHPTLTEAYARGGAVRKIVSLLETTWIFEANTYDARSGAYEGTFLDLTALAHDLGRPGAQSLLQALSLSLVLAGLDESLPVVLETGEITSNLKTGERTHQRVTLDRLPELPGLLEDLANRGGGRGFRGEALPRERIEELLAPRLKVGTKLSTFIRALETREVPAKGPLAKAELWDIELLLDTGDVASALPRIEGAERLGGRTPATAYLRARHDVLARAEPPTILAQRVAALALSMTSFVELGLLAGEAWLIAADGRRAQAYARDVLDTKGIDEVLRERAKKILSEASKLPSPSTTGMHSVAPPRSKAPSFGPGPADERVPSFFGDPRAEPDLDLDRRPLEEREVRAAESPASPQRTTKHPSFGPGRATPTRVGVASDEVFSAAAPHDASRRETSRPPSFAGGSRPPSVDVGSPPRSLTPPPGVPRRMTSVGLGLAEAAALRAKTAPPPAPGHEDRTVAARTAPPPAHEDRTVSARTAPPPAHEDRTVAARIAPPPASFREDDEPPLLHEELTPPPVRVPFPSSFPAPPTDDPRDRKHDSVHPAMREMPTPTLSGEFMRGATRPPSLEAERLVASRFAKAPLFLPSETNAVEAAEHLPLPAGLAADSPTTDALPRSVIEARIQFTLLSRELGASYRITRNVELRADLSGIEHMQAYLFDRFAKRRVESPEAARDVQLHGAFLSEILSRRLGAEWSDISADILGHWEMAVAPGTRVWPFGRVARLIAKGHRERDLVAYFLELQAKRDRGAK